MKFVVDNDRRIRSKLMPTILTLVIVLCIYIFVFSANLHRLHHSNARIYLPAIGGGVAALISCLLISVVDEWLGTALFSIGLILIGISQGLQNPLRIITMAFSIVVHIGAIGYFIKLYQIRKGKKKFQKMNNEAQIQDTFGFVFTSLIILGFLQIFRLTSLLLFPFSVYKSIPVWLVIMGAGVVIITLWLSFWSKYKRLLILLIINVIILALSLVVRGTTEWVINIILLLILAGSALYIAKEYNKITGGRVRINKIPLVLGLLLLTIFLTTLAISLI